MRSFFKVGLISIGLVLILIGVVGAMVLTQAQSLLTGVVEEMLTDAFGSSATVAAVTMSPSTGALLIHDFTLANPQGFIQGDAFTAKRIDVSMKPSSLLSRIHIIDKMEVVGGNVRLRYELGQGTNLGALANILAERPMGEATKFRVRELVCEEAKLHLDTNLLPTPGMSLNVVTLRLEDLENGSAVTSAQITSIFLRSVLMEVMTLKGLLSPVLEKMRGETGGD